MSEFLEIITQKVEENDFSHAAQVMKDPTQESELKKHVRDLVPLFLKKIGGDEAGRESNRLLEIVVSKAEPEEVVLEFLEQMEEVDSVKFGFILKLLFISLERCAQNKMRYTETSLVTIRSCMEDAMVSDKDFLMEEEYEEELYNKLGNITAVFESVLDFYEKFASLISSKSPGYDTAGMLNLFLSRLVQMFDFFLPVDDSKTLQSLNSAMARTLELIKKLLRNPFYFLEFIFFRTLRYQNRNKAKGDANRETGNLRVLCDDIKIDCLNEGLSVFGGDYVISNLGYAVFFYTILCSSKSADVYIPSVYNPKFIFLSLAPLSLSFLEKNFNKYIHKGLQFIHSLLDMISDVELNRLDLYFEYHEKILTQLNYIMVYSQNEHMRKMAATCFKDYIEAFDHEARYLLLVNVRPAIEHSGTLGLLITSLKEYVCDYLDYESCRKYSKYYSGKLLYGIIARYCFLTRGDETDLVMDADQIISSLNLLRFILLKDKENKTELRNCIAEIDKNYLQPLRKGIDLAKDFYRMRLDHLQMSEENEPVNTVELTVNGQPVKNITKEEQENALFSSLNAVDLIDCLLHRVQECITNIK